jgi:hypothetical protein
MFKHLKSISLSVLTLSLWAAPAWAQFEVSPDHFETDQDSKTAISHEQELQAQVRDLQAQIVSSQAHVRAQSEMVEEARQAAISAGILGDDAGSYIEAYRLQQKQLDSLQQSLTAQIAEVRNIVADLNIRAALVIVAAKADTPRLGLRRRTNLQLRAQHDYGNRQE